MKITVTATEALALHILAAFAGIIAGAVTGLLPGLHINLVSVIAVSLIGTPDFNAKTALAAFIIAMSISHVFHEFIPSVFLGFSDSEGALAVLPGHRMLLKGEGRKAVLLACSGAFAGVLALIILAPLLLAAAGHLYAAAKDYIALFLVAVIAAHFIKSRSIKNAAANAIVIILSGAFGMAVFSLPVIREPLLPMFSGLFGASSLLTGLFRKPGFPSQKADAAIRTKKPVKIAKLLALGIISSSLMGLFPALGPAQAAMLGTAASRKLKPSSYMFLLGVISSASMLFALFTLYAFGKARNGSIAVMSDIVQLDLSLLALMLAVALLAASASLSSTLCLSRTFVSFMEKANYVLLSWLILAAIAILVLAFSGPLGLIVFAVATAIGMIPLLAQTSRQMLMGCLMVPVIGYYLYGF